jgi:iron-sulfur cluster assembly accessory protein
MTVNVTVTERAARRIGEILRQEPAGTMLRVSVEGGGCSGFQYKFDTERERTENDIVIEKSGATVLIESTIQKRRRPAAAVRASHSSVVDLKFLKSVSSGH